MKSFMIALAMFFLVSTIQASTSIVARTDKGCKNCSTSKTDGEHDQLIHGTVNTISMPSDSFSGVSLKAHSLVPAGPLPVRQSDGTIFYDGASEAKQDTAITALGLLSTEAKQDTAITALGLLSTEAKQDTLINNQTSGDQKGQLVSNDGSTPIYVSWSAATLPATPPVIKLAGDGYVPSRPPFVPVGSLTQDHGSVVVGNGAAVEIVPADPTRRSIVIVNIGTDQVAFGNSDVTLNSADATDSPPVNGGSVANDGTGNSFESNGTDAIFGKGASGGSKVSWFAEFDD